MSGLTELTDLAAENFGETLSSVKDSVSGFVGDSLSGVKDAVSDFLGEDVGDLLKSMKSSSWRTQLRPASFRGVRFKVHSCDFEGGRRKDVNEYPQRDRPSVRDMGRKAREYPLRGYVIGNDYMAQRNALRGALEKEGPGPLVHPYYGSLKVHLLSFRIHEEPRDGGMAVFDLNFIEAGDSASPKVEKSTSASLLSKAQKVLNKLNALFAGRYSLKGLANWAREAVGADISSLYDSFETLVRQADSSGNWLASFNRARAKAKNGMDSASVLAAATQAALTPPEGVSLNLAKITRWATGADTGTVLTANGDRVQDLARGTLLAQGAALVAEATIGVYDDAMAARDTFLKAIDFELVSAVDDDAYVAWSDLRSAVYEDLTGRARQAARLKEITPLEVVPAVVLAYDVYEDADRDLEIVARNAIRNPNFVSPEPLKLLSI